MPTGPAVHPEDGLAERVRQLEEALETRTVVARAQGIIMERYELDAGRAFEVLQRISNQSHIKVRDIATYLIETRQLPK